MIKKIVKEMISHMSDLEEKNDRINELENKIADLTNRVNKMLRDANKDNDWTEGVDVMLI